MQFVWETLEYEHHEKNRNWFWIVGLGGAVLILLAILMKNFLLAILLLLTAFALILHGGKRPDKITIAISRQGIQVRHLLYPFKTLRSFCVHDHLPTKKITLRSDRAFMPHLHLPLAADVNHEAVRLFLLEHLPEEHHEPTLIDALVEYL